jgi:hypothetical protein
MSDVDRREGHWTIMRQTCLPTEIAASMHAVLTGSEPGLVGYWRFDDVNGPKALDSSPTNASTTLFAPALDGLHCAGV